MCTGHHWVGQLLLLACHEDLGRENDLVARVDVAVANGLCREDVELRREADSGLLSSNKGEKTEKSEGGA